MSDRGPTASEVASELRTNELEGKLKMHDPMLYERYSERVSRERLLVGSVGGGAALLAVIALQAQFGPSSTGGAIAFSIMAAAMAFGVAGGITALVCKESSEILSAFERDMWIAEKARNQGIEAMARKVDEVAAKAAGGRK